MASAESNGQGKDPQPVPSVTASGVLTKLADLLKYLAGAALAMIYFHYALEKLMGKSVWMQFAFYGLVPLTALFAVLFLYIPARRARLERMRPKLGPDGTRHDYFTTAPRTKKDAALFGAKYQPYLDWLKTTERPVLVLRGESGAGKSSLIQAALAPKLARAGMEVTVLRSHDNPLEQLAAQLGLSASLEDLVATVLDHLQRLEQEPGKRRLFIIDQFEEFFLIRETLQDGKEAATTDDRTAAFKSFLHGLLHLNPKRSAILLSYRSDHQALIDRLELPWRQSDKNWMELLPMPYDEAEAFIKGCPGLVIPAERLELLMMEAARQEGSNKVMKPIVANILGIVLQRMAAHPTDWKRDKDLLRAYVLDGLGDEVRLERARICKAMLSETRTAKVRDLETIAKRTGLTATRVENHLMHMRTLGLMRCLNEEEQMPAKRKWQISHDFIAKLMERVVHGVQRTFWRTVRPWLAPTTLGLALVLYAFLMESPKERAVRVLNDAGLVWSPYSRTVSVDQNAHLKSVISNPTEFSNVGLLINSERLNSLNAHLKILNPLIIDLWKCDKITSVAGLSGLRELTYLELGDCDALTSISGLQDLPSLSSLSLISCDGLNDLTGIEQLSDLTFLSLRYCINLDNVDELKEVITLQSLDLRNCDNISDLNGLINHRMLEVIALDGLTDLNSITPLFTCESLRYVGLSECCSGVPLVTLDSLLARGVDTIAAHVDSARLQSSNRPRQ